MRTVPVIAAVTAALCSAQAALAQDSQYPPVPFYDWTGVYVGGNIGYGSATINDTTASCAEATNLRDVEVPMLLPGIKINTSPTDYYPVQQLQLARFDGKRWVRFGDLVYDE